MGALGVDEAVVQDLAGVEEAIAHLRQHKAEGVLEGDDVPELNKVLLLALVRQRLLVGRLLRMHCLRKLLCTPNAPHRQLHRFTFTPHFNQNKAVN